MTNICLIRPPMLLSVFSTVLNPTPPLGLAFIAGALRRGGHKVTIVDAIAEKPEQYSPFHENIVTNGLTNREVLERIPPDTDIIGLTIMFTDNWLSDRKLIDFLGENLPGLVIIAGGEHITGMPELCMRQTKYLKLGVLGEGEETVVEVIKAIELGSDLSAINGIVYKTAGGIVVNERRTRVKEVEDIAWPAWELFPLENYRANGLSYGVVNGEMSLPILATRGCPYSCTFCSSPQMWGTRYYMRSPQDVANEMEKIKNDFGATNFDFFDLTAVVKRNWIIEFAREVLNRKLNITWQIPAGTRSEAIDAEVARYLYLSGCKNITYAPESGSPEILRKIRKKVVLSRMLESISHSHKEKLNIKLNMIIGFPEERHIHIWQTMWFLIKASWYGVNDISPVPLVPYTGCEIYTRLLKEGKINPERDDYYYRIVLNEKFFGGYFYNDNISATALKIYRLSYLLIFYSSNYLFRPQRFFRTLRNLIIKRPESRGEQHLINMIKRKSKFPEQRERSPVLSGKIAAA